MRIGWRAAVGGLVVVLAMAGGPVQAEPYEDGQASGAGSRYSNRADLGWMTAASSEIVYDIAQIGNRIYLAGSFTGIRYGTGGSVSRRGYLIALDADSGDPIWSFAPRFNGNVYTLAVSDDGQRLYAGGAFTQVNGRDQRRIVALAPGGAVDVGFQGQVGNGTVRSIVATRSYLYVGGSFWTVNGAGRSGLVRLQRSAGTTDRAWNAGVSGGSVLTLEMPPSRDRLYAGGRFRSVNGAGGTDRLVALRTQDGRTNSGFARQPGRDVFDILADGRGRVWLALDDAGGRAELLNGSGGLLRGWDVDGDVQTIERIGDRVFFGGHNLVPDDRSVATVSYDAPGGWDASTFLPGVNGGSGVWALHADGDRLWVGAQSRAPFTGFGRFDAR
jgi:Domain of unknown function (DUF5122) beta-propeller